MATEAILEAAPAPPLATVGDALSGAALARLNLVKFADKAHFPDEPSEATQPSDEPATVPAPLEVEPNTPENPEAQPEAPTAEDDADPLADLPLDAKAQERINARIGKFKAEAATATEAKAALEAQLAEMQTRLTEMEQQTAEIPPAAPSAEQPLAHVTNQQQLAAEHRQAKDALVYAEDQLDLVDDNPDAVANALRKSGVVLKDEQGDEDYSPTRMKSFLKSVKRNADRIMRDAIPARAEYLAAVQRSQAQAVEMMPELKDAKSPVAQTAQRILKAFPTIQQNPNWPQIVMVHALGLAEYEKRIGKPAAAPAPAKLPPKLAQKPAAAPAASTRKGLSEDVYERAARGDSEARQMVALNQLAR